MLLNKIKKLQYFDQDLQLIKDKFFKLKIENDPLVEKEFLKELKFVRKVLTIRRYLECPESYDLIENPKQVITKMQFKKNVTSEQAAKAEDGSILTGGFPAQYMNEVEFKNLLKECTQKI